MGPGKNGAFIGFPKLLQGDVKALKRAQAACHLLIPGLPAVLKGLEKPCKILLLGMDTKPQNMDITSLVCGGKLNAGDKFQTKAGGCPGSLGKSLRGVVICQGKSAKPLFGGAGRKQVVLRL